MTTRIRFNAQPHHSLDLGDGKVVMGGKEIDVADELAERLAAADYVDVTIVDGKRPTWPRTNADIDELAGKLGVTLPVPAADGSTTIKLADKVAALEAAGFTPETAAAKVAENDNAKES